jgi:hypothetical protein
VRKVAAALLVAGVVAVSANARGNGRQPCDRGAGGVSHCQGDKFVCKDGRISGSKQKCTQAAGAAGAGKATGGAGLTCAGKRYCKDMDSCDEARHYLTRCGVRSLDRDGDGVPCESLCGGR